MAKYVLKYIFLFLALLFIKIQPLAINKSLHDFSIQDLQQINYVMEHRPIQKTIWKTNENYNPSSRAYFAYNLYKQPLNKYFLAAQYERYDRLYHIGKYQKQLPLCVVAVGRNMNRNFMLQRFIDSVVRQNYSNYEVFYSDDASTDQSVLAFNNYVSKLSQEVKKKFKVIPHGQQQYALKNRNEAIRYYCKQYSIILDVDIDDSFIGNQVFKLLSAVYQYSNPWYVYSAHIRFDFDKKEPIIGISKQISQKQLQENSYRISDDWVTSELRSFQKSLYIKIDQRDFLDQKDQYYKWASDRFMIYPMIEMAGKNHIRYLPEVLYYYDLASLSQRDYTFIIPDKMKAKMQPPYIPLTNLFSKPERYKNYSPPQNLVQENKRAQKQAKKKRKEQQKLKK